MVGRQEPSFLKESGDKCLSRLQKLKKQAEEGLFSRSSFSRAKRELLHGVVQDVNDSLRNLEAWIKEFAKADQTRDSELLEQAGTLFDVLTHSILKTDQALNSRLRHKNSRLRGLFFSKRYGSLIAAEL